MGSKPSDGKFLFNCKITFSAWKSHKEVTQGEGIIALSKIKCPNRHLQLELQILCID